MNHQENKMDELAQSENEDQQPQNSAAHSIDVNSIDLVEIVIEMGNGKWCSGCSFSNCREY
ncbi:hypothetical protein [Acinetobacter sp. Tr-809]|uniref:hypothetical protein n=1 Tax=Acinetobacter sp. Tr-809 TaxID=2608324 RepID=UPI001D17E2E4|nr:hypothetical protein [Acinetobacter sp. Tr-809]